MNLLPSSLSKNDSLSHFFSLNDARVTGQTAETTDNQEFLEFTTGDWAYSRYPVCSCVQQKLMIVGHEMIAYIRLFRHQLSLL
jgi:hypothetical protein